MNIRWALTAVLCLTATLALTGCGDSSSQNPLPPGITAAVWYFPESSTPWNITARVAADYAIRVYATSDHINGEYDLYYCSDYDSSTNWVASNAPDCVQPPEGGNYKLPGKPNFPLTVTIHVVSKKRTDTYPVTITDFETIYF